MIPFASARKVDDSIYFSQKRLNGKEWDLYNNRNKKYDDDDYNSS